MANDESLIIGLDGDDTQLRRKLDGLFDYAEKKGKTVFGKKPGQSPSMSPGATKAKEGREKQRQERELQKQGALKYYGAGRQHTSETVEAGHDVDELKGGGFYGAFERKFAAIKAGKDWVKSFKKKGNEDDQSGMSPGLNSPYNHNSNTPGLSGIGGKYGNITIQAQNVNVRNRPGMGTPPPMPGLPRPWDRPNRQPDTETGLDSRGGMWQKLGATLPIVGAFAAIAGGLMQLVSAAGQRYASALGKQSGTIGATGVYVGGGLGYFGNSEVAQSMIALGKASGQDIFEKGNQAGDFMAFAAGQGESLSSVMQSIGTLRKANKGVFGIDELNQIRAEGYKAGFENLRESEFLQGIAQRSESNRQQGIYNDPMAFASFAASLQGPNMTADRRLGLAGALADKSLAGIQGGGMFGALALVKAMQESGGDYFQAERLKDMNPEKYMQLALKEFESTQEGRNIRGFMMKKEGISRTMTEGMDLTTDTSRPGAAPGIRAGSSPIVSAENLIDQTYMEVGKLPFQFSQELLKDMAEMTRTLTPTVETISKGLLTIESKLGEFAKESAEKVNDFVASMQELMKGIQEAGGFQEWFKKSVKEALIL